MIKQRTVSWLLILRMSNLKNSLSKKQFAKQIWLAKIERVSINYLFSGNSKKTVKKLKYPRL